MARPAAAAAAMLRTRMARSLGLGCPEAPARAVTIPRPAIATATRLPPPNLRVPNPPCRARRVQRRRPATPPPRPRRPCVHSRSCRSTTCLRPAARCSSLCTTTRTSRGSFRICGPLLASSRRRQAYRRKFRFRSLSLDNSLSPLHAVARAQFEFAAFDCICKLRFFQQRYTRSRTVSDFKNFPSERNLYEECWGNGLMNERKL